MSWISNLFEAIARRLGFEINKKIDKPREEIPLPITRMMSNRVANLALLDSQISITGESKRASFLDNLFKATIQSKINVACEVSLATGDCLIKPYTDGKLVGFNIIPSNDFAIIDSVGDFIKSVLIRVENLLTEQGVLTRAELHRLIEEENGTTSVEVTTMAFLDDQRIPLSNVGQWSHIPEVIKISNVNNLLFGRIKSATVSHKAINSPYGAKITDGLEPLINECIKAFNRFNKEFEDKETMIFADKTIFGKDEYGRVQLGAKSKLVQTIRGDDTKNLIDVFSPEIRSQELQDALEVNFRAIETASGLSNGVLSTPRTANATATEILAGLRNTYAYVSSFRKNIERGVRELVYAIDIILNANNITERGEYDVTFNWSSTFITHLSEEFNQLMQAESIGAISLAEIRSWLTDEDMQTAEEKVKEILRSRGIDDDEVDRY